MHYISLIKQAIWTNAVTANTCPTEFPSENPESIKAFI